MQSPTAARRHRRRNRLFVPRILAGTRWRDPFHQALSRERAVRLIQEHRDYPNYSAR